MLHWTRFEADGRAGFGTLDGDTITVHDGDMFHGAVPTERRLPREAVRLLPPVEPTKIVALWNNFHALAAKLNVAEPPEPLYLMKAPTSIAAPDETVRRPASYDGKVVYEGELAIVIGRTCRNVSEEEAGNFIFGYTCVNDLTAADILNRDPTFAQWVRAKSFDGFCPVGPVIATGLDPERLTVRTILNGEERQNYSLGDMIFPPKKLVSLLSRDMTLLPGDIICCGTSLGVGSIKEAENVVDIVIDGIGTLRTRFEQ